MYWKVHIEIVKRLSDKETELLEHHKAKLATTQLWNTGNRDSNESRKISLDGIWLNPKYYIIGNQQESLE